MVNARSVICTPQRESARVWAISLEALGSRTEHVESYGAVGTSNDLLVAYVTGAGQAGEALRALGEDRSGVVVLPKPDLRATLDALRHTGVRAVTVEEYADARLMTYIGSKLLRGDIFGVAKVLPWGARVQSMIVNSNDERIQALADADQFVRTLNIRSKHREAIGTVIDELLMNALYDAPVGANGPLFGDVAPRDRGGLRLERPAILQLACDGRRLAVGVRDSFGSLTRQLIVSNLQRCLTQGGEIQRKTSGAGLGLYIVVNSVTEFIANLLPGTATEIICVFALDVPAQQLKHFGIYEETFAKLAETRESSPARLVGAGAGAAPRMGRMVPATLALAMAVLVVAGMLLIWPYLSRPAKGSLRVTVSPSGSAVYINGVRRGTGTPLLTVGDLDPGPSYAVSARHSGYEPAEEVVGVLKGRAQDVRLTLRQLGAKVRVSSMPAGAEIWLDGKRTGQQTPSLLENLVPGRRYEIRLVRHGYLPAASELTPTAAETLRVQVSLPPARNFGRLSLTSTPPGARLSINRLDTGLTTPIAEYVLRAGQTYAARLDLRGRVPWEQQLVLGAEGEQITRAVTLSLGGEVSIHANIVARVHVPGVAKPLPLPLERVLPVGKQRVRLRGDHPYVDFTLLVNVEEGQRSVHKLMFGFVASSKKNLRIAVDDQTRVARIALPAGKHSLTLLDTKSGETRPVKVTVEAGKEIKVP
jgi:hypothetical protein